MEGAAGTSPLKQSPARDDIPSVGLHPDRPVRRILVFLAAGLIAAACGPAQAPSRVSPDVPTGFSQSVSAVSEAHDATAAAGSYRVAFHGEMHTNIPSSSGTFVTGTGIFNATAKRSSLDLVLTKFDQPGIGAIPAGLEDPHLIVDGDTAYLRLPGTVATKNASWARFSASGMFDPGPNPDDTGPFGLSDSVGLADPANALAALGALGTTVTVMGPDSVRGVAATRYETTLDPGLMGAAAGVVPSPSPGDPFAGIDALPSDVGADVWIDGRGRVVRLTLTIDMSAADNPLMQFLGGLSNAFGAASAQPSYVTMTFTTENYDFGTPATISVPGPAGVAGVNDVPALAGS